MKTALLAVSLMLGPAAWGQGHSCENLHKLSIPNTRVLSAQTVAAGSLRLQGNSDAELAAGKPFMELPAFCRVVLEIEPAAGSRIPVELWMPAENWNGRFLGVGNGGFAGQIGYRELATAVSKGYASAATDTGHSGSPIDASWALGHPQAIIDFGYRAIHEMTLKSKMILQSFYSGPLRHSYFAACSDGGREALMEAQRFPQDYDGILAGAPAYNWTRLMTNAVVNSQALLLKPASYIPAAKLPAISAAALEKCDKKDGLADGILDDPRRCKFDPSVLLCKEADTNRCLTQPQVDALHALYSGARDKAGQRIFPGYVPGGELGEGGWGLWILGPAPGRSLMNFFGNGYFADMVYGNANWDYKTLSADTGLADGLQKTGGAIDATNPDLRPFAKRGGRLILYHGWSDAAISALSSIDYYNNVRTTASPATEDSTLRLFMVPGMQHCSGGPGPDSFGQAGPDSASGPDDPQHDILLALQHWVEDGVAPETVIAAQYAGEGAARKITRTRPLCAYPKVARYKGAGSTDDAANFVCRAEP
ncbi:MAG TPA: tannase/feruloyl esterase family alpha/beta hydrolase [Terracidiphilus sp.]